MYDPRDDTERFSLGTILTKLKVATREEVDEVLRIQEDLTPEQHLGEILVASGVLTREVLDLALETQRELRSAEPGRRAHAAAKLAQVSSDRVVRTARLVRATSDEVRRKSNQTGYPAIREPLKGSGTP